MDKQDVTNYVPTPAEEKLLKVLLDPDSLGMTITDICAKAGVDRNTYYRAFDKPGFKAYQRDRAQNLLAQALLPTIHAFQKEAKKGSFPHGKIMLEMHDLYTEKKELDVKAEVKLTELLDDDEGTGETET